MIIIINEDAVRFSYNGLKLDKSFRARPFSTDSVVLNNIYNNQELYKPVHFSELSIDGVVYASQTEAINALNSVVYSGVGGAVSISDNEGNPAGPIYPLSVGLDIIYENDIDWNASDFTGWTGNPRDLFNNVNNGGIDNDSADNPKSFILRLVRTRIMRDFGIGASTGSFSNIKVTVLGSGDAERGILDLSEEDSQQKSMVYSEEQFAFNAIKVEFITSNRIDVSNIFLQNTRSEKQQNYIHKFGLNPDIDTGDSETIWTLGDQYIFTTTPQAYFISSSNDGDASQTIKGELIVIDSDGKLRREIYEVQLQGQTKVQIPTSNNWLCIASNRAFNDSDIPLSGDAYIYEDTTISGGVPNDLSFVRSHISQGREQTEQAVYTIPQVLESGQLVAFAQLYKWSASAIRNRSTSGLLNLVVSEFGKTPRIKGTRALSDNFISVQNFGDHSPLVINPASDVWIQASELSINSVAVEADFSIELITL